MRHLAGPRGGCPGLSDHNRRAVKTGTPRAGPPAPGVSHAMRRGCLLNHVQISVRPYPQNHRSGTSGEAGLHDIRLLRSSRVGLVF